MVVDELHLLELDGLLDVQLLLVLEDAFVEELPQLLVAVVDGELLKAVDLEVLEAGTPMKASERSKGKHRLTRATIQSNSLEYRALAKASRPNSPSLTVLPLKDSAPPTEMTIRHKIHQFSMIHDKSQDKAYEWSTAPS